MTTTTDTEAPATERMIDKIKGLLAKAESTDNEHEAEVFFAKAAELMEKYRVDPDVIRDRKAEFQLTTHDMTQYRYLRASFSLLVVTAKHYGVIVSSPATGNSKTPHLFGEEDDIESTLMMFRSLIRQRDHAIDLHRVPAGVHTTRFRTSMALGFFVTVDERLRMIRAAAKDAEREAGNGMALEVFGRYDKALSAAQHVSKKGGVSRNAPTIDRSGFVSGQEAGQRADLGGTRLGNGPTAIGR